MPEKEVLDPITAIAALQQTVDLLLPAMPTISDRLIVVAALRALADRQEDLTGLNKDEPPPKAPPVA